MSVTRKKLIKGLALGLGLAVIAPPLDGQVRAVWPR